MRLFWCFYLDSHLGYKKRGKSYDKRSGLPPTSLQGRNRDTDVENKHMDTKEGKRGEGYELRDWDWHIYTNMYKIDN